MALSFAALMAVAKRELDIRFSVISRDDEKALIRLIYVNFHSHILSTKIDARIVRPAVLGVSYLSKRCEASAVEKIHCGQGDCKIFCSIGDARCVHT